MFTLLPRWMQIAAIPMVAMWGIGMVASMIIGSFTLADAIGQLARILVPTDFSAHAHEALEHARSLAVQQCQIAIRNKSAYWPRRADGLCHIKDLQTASAAVK